VEGLEDGTQKSVGQQHAWSGHVDDGNALFGGNGFEDVLAPRCARSDAGAFAGWIARIEYVDGNILLNRRQHRRGMQDFGAKVGEFGGFVEADDLNATSLGTDAR